MMRANNLIAPLQKASDSYIITAICCAVIGAVLIAISIKVAENYALCNTIFLSGIVFMIVSGLFICGNEGIADQITEVRNGYKRIYAEDFKWGEPGEEIPCHIEYDDNRQLAFVTNINEDQNNE